MGKFREQIDHELREMMLTDEMKWKIRREMQSPKKRTLHPRFVLAIVLLAALLVGGIVAVAGSISQETRVNRQKLPELDVMQVKTIRPVKGCPYPSGKMKLYFDSYDELQEALGIELLSAETEKNKFTGIEVKTDGKDYVHINITNYILGDSDYQETATGYEYLPGEKYHSPVDLKIEIALSDWQLQNLSSVDYVGEYRFVEQYTSEKGYKVNLIKSRTSNWGSVAIFVADGVQYTLEGSVSTEEMKQIVDLMQ